jgi:hypothetical protein
MARIARALLSARPHLIFSMAMFLLLAGMMVEQDQGTRAMLFVAALVSYLGFMATFGLEVNVAALSRLNRGSVEVEHVPIPGPEPPDLEAPKPPDVRDPLDPGRAIIRFFTKLQANQ